MEQIINAILAYPTVHRVPIIPPYINAPHVPTKPIFSTTPALLVLPIAKIVPTTPVPINRNAFYANPISQ